MPAAGCQDHSKPHFYLSNHFCRLGFNSNLIVLEVFRELLGHSNELGVDVDAEDTFRSKPATDLERHRANVATDVLEKEFVVDDSRSEQSWNLNSSIESGRTPLQAPSLNINLH